MRARAYRAAEAIRHSLRNGFTAYNVISPVNGFLATVIGGTCRQLDASTAASGPHVFAVRTSRARLSQLLRPPLPVPRRDVGQRPSCRDGTGKDVPLICPSGK